MTSTLRAVVADDHPAFRSGVAAILRDAGIEVIAEVGDGVAALAAVVTGQPDIALLDLSMPEMGGVEATRRIASESSDTAVLVLTMSEDDDSLFAALSAGARGYLLKGSLATEIVAAVRTVADGVMHLPAAMAERVVLAAIDGRSASPPAAFPDLTARETQVLELVALGLDNAAIAERLGLSAKTVRNLVSHVRVSIGASTRAEAVAMARDAGVGRR